MNADMDKQVHYLEKEAYFSVLRAFKAQSDAITWDKEGLITELRKELRVSDDEHRDVLGRVNNDESICRIREWRQTGRHQAPLLLPVHDGISSPTVSASRKKQRNSQPLPAFFVPSPAINPRSVSTTVQPSPSMGPQGRKSKLSSVVNGKNQSRYHDSSVVMPHEAAAALGKELIGRKVYTRWPEDNKFYEAVITRFNPLDGRHILMYDVNTENETWEWVDLKQISPDDIRWLGEDPGISHRGITGDNKSNGPTLPSKSRQKKEFQNGNRKIDTDDIEILRTESLIKVVEDIVAANHPNRSEIEKAKKMLKDHEEALEYAISKLTDASDGESGDENICI